MVFSRFSQKIINNYFFCVVIMQIENTRAQGIKEANVGQVWDLEKTGKLGGIERIKTKFPRVNDLVKQVTSDSDEVISAMRIGPLNVKPAMTYTISQKLSAVADNAEMYSKTGRVEISEGIAERIVGEFGREYPDTLRDIELDPSQKDPASKIMKANIARIAVALSNELSSPGDAQESGGGGEAVPEKERIENLDTAGVLRSVKKAVGKAVRDGDFDAAQYLSERGINRKALQERGLCQDSSQSWHTGPDGAGLEILMPLGVGRELPIQGQPEGGPETVFDGKWEKLGYSQAEVQAYRHAKDVWWHTAETTFLMRLHTDPSVYLGKKPSPGDVAARKTDVDEALGQPGQDAFKMLTNLQAYKPSLKKMGVSLEYLMKEKQVSLQQALRLGYSRQEITQTQ